MKSKKSLAILAALIALLLCCVTFTAVALSEGKNIVYENESGIVRYKTEQSDPADPSGGRGLLLYAYDSGASAKYKSSVRGIFQAELRPVVNEFGSEDLRSYSLRFTDNASGANFSVIVSQHGGYNNVSVEHKGERAGIVYFESASKPPQAYGLTAAYNSEGSYTRFTSESASLRFDPATMTVYARLDDGAYYPVWNFNETYNDGKRLENELTAFDSYTVEIVFDDIAPNGRGDLLVYSFAGYALDGDLSELPASVYASFTSKAVVGREYALPEAEVSHPAIGTIPEAKTKVFVYDSQGRVQNAEETQSFIPDIAGKYYVYYTYEGEYGNATAYYMLEAVTEEEIEYSFRYESDAAWIAEAGVYSAFYVPSAEFYSTLFMSSRPSACSVTVRKDGEIVDGYEKVPGGFTFVFKEPGNYSLVYSADGYPSAEDIKEIAVDSTLLGVEETGMLARTYRQGETLSVPQAVFYRNGQALPARSEIVFPSGAISGEDAVGLSETGNYVLRYSYGENEVYEREFTVCSEYASFFTDGGAYGEMRMNNQTSGVEFSLAENETVEYQEAIDLSEYTFDDVTKEGKRLIKLFAQPNMLGTSDFDSIFITLTDKYDASNSLTIRIKYLSYFQMGTTIRAKASNQTTYVGYYYDFTTTQRRVDSASTHEEGGYQCSFSAVHQLDEYAYDTTSLQLYFDYPTKSLYARPTWLTGHSGYENVVMPWLVYDFDSADSELSAGNTPWAGFTTGEIYLSLYAKGVSGSADIFISEIDGEDLSQRYFFDKSEPVITVNTSQLDSIPKAKVKVPYKLFDFAATDADSAIVESGVQVFHASSGREFPVVDHSFTPTVEGDYIVRYTAKDSFGNIAEQEITVEAARTLSLPQIEIAGDLPASAVYGTSVSLPSYTCTDEGAGAVRVSITVSCGEEDIPVENGVFICLGGVGLYEVTYIAEDYLGQKTYQTEQILVERSESPVFDESTISLPSCFLERDGYVFDDYTAVFYGSDLAENIIAVKIEITDGAGTHILRGGDTYIPVAQVGMVDAKIRFLFENPQGENLIIERYIPIKTAAVGADYMQNFFTYENAAVSSSSAGLVFTSAGDPMRFGFVRPVNARELLLRFTISADTFDAESFTLRIWDMYDVSQEIKLVFKKSGGEFVCCVNGGRETNVNFSTDGYLQIRYLASANTIYDGLNASLGTLSVTSAGVPFYGFSSGYVYFDCTLSGIGSSSAVGIRTINNQTVNSARADMQAPYIYINGEYEGRVASNTQITVYSAEAYDVLSSLGELTVTVRKDGGSILVNEQAAAEDFVLTAVEYGTYTIIYSVADGAGQRRTESVYFTVYDSVKPSLAFAAELPDTVEVGYTLELPAYTVSDNAADTVSVKIYVMRPDGGTDTVTGTNYMFSEAGCYTLNYLAMDENDNSVLYSFDVKAI